MDDKDYERLERQIASLQKQLEQIQREKNSTQCKVVVFEKITQNLWYQMLQNVKFPVETLDQLSKHSLATTEALYAFPEAQTLGEQFHTKIQNALHYEEEFWKGVRQHFEFDQKDKGKP